MGQRGAWLTPTLYGTPTFTKPPLLYWAARAVYAVLGPTILAGRLPVALSAAALCLLIASLARRMFGPSAALPAALLAISTFGVFRFGRLAMMDVPMALALSLAAWAAYRAEDEGKPALLLWAGVGAGFSALLKGPVGPLLIMLTAGGYLQVRARSLLWSRWTAAAFGLGAAIAIPWYAASLAVHGRAFFDWFFIEEHLGKFRKGNFFTSFAYLGVGLAGMPAPWTVLLAAAVPRLRPRADKRDLLLALWAGSVLLVFGLPSVKFAHYIVAALPALVLMLVRQPLPRWARAITGALLVSGGAVLLLAVRWPLPAPAVAALVAASLLLGSGGVLIGQGRLAGAAGSVAVGVMLVFGVAIPAAGPPAYPAEKLAVAGDRRLYSYTVHAALVNDTSPSPAGRAFYPESVDAVLDEGNCVAMPERSLEELPEAIREKAVVLERWYHLAPPSSWDALWRSWRRADLGELMESMVLITRASPRS
jgi:4-amino-4-deoxy-L-arabinose transferase-like glycosyltransferase